MTVETFTSHTSRLRAQLWNYSREQWSYLGEKDQKQRLEFKMFSMAFYLIKIMNDSLKFQKAFQECIEILDMNVSDATYGEPMDAFLSFHIGEGYFSEKLHYYMNAISTSLKDDSHYPKFCYTSIISNPLEKIDNHFLICFNNNEYNIEFHQQVKTLLRLMEVCFTQPEFYLNKLKEAEGQIKLDILDPNRNKLITEELIKLIGN